MSEGPKTFGELFEELSARMAERLADPAYQAKVAAWEREQALDAQAQRRHARKFLGIPAVLAETLDRLEETDALAKARSFLASEKLILLLAGDVGRGKSVAAAWAVAETNGRFIEAADVAQANVYDREAWGALFLPRLLAVDELGMEPLDAKGWCEAKLYDLINGRLQAKKRTVLVSNLDLPAFLARYPDPRLRDRLRAHGAWLLAKGPSMRGEP
jgi:DNA replication protein DnaC